MARLRAPFSWVGGKHYMVRHILPLLPEHRQYVEPFFGAGSVFFARDPAEVETVNDLNGGVTGFFAALRDHPDEMQRLAALTPCSRELWMECRDTWEEEEDPVRRAWRWWVVAGQSFGGAFGKSWGYNTTLSRRGIANICSTRLAYIDRFAPVAERLLGTQIENAPALRVMGAHASPDTLFYLDPPYISETRKGDVYAHEMTGADHAALVAAILELPGKFVVSGYNHPLYAPLEEAGWTRLEFRAHAWGSSAGRTLSASATPGQNDRTESVWLDPATAAEVLPAAQTRLQLEAAG